MINMARILKTAKVAKPKEKKVSVPGKRRNDRAGHSWERECRDKVRNIGFVHVTTSRAESKSRDKKKIDLMNQDEHINGRLPISVQCKNSCQPVNYAEILTTGYKKVVTLKKTGEKKVIDVPPMPKEEGIINVIFHKLTTNEPFISSKNELVDNGAFRTIGHYATCSLEDFLVLVAAKKELDELKHTK